MDSLPTVLAIVSSAAGAVWVLRSKLSDLEKALEVHSTEDQAAHAAQEELEARVLKLERKRR